MKSNAITKRRSRFISVASMLAVLSILVALVTAGNTASASTTQPACTSKPLTAQLELGSWQQVRTTFTLGCKQLGQAITVPGNSVTLSQQMLATGATVPVVVITPASEPTNAGEEAAAHARLGLSNAQIMAFTHAFAQGKTKFTPVASVTMPYTQGVKVDPSQAFAKQLAARTVSKFAPAPAVSMQAPGDIYDYGCAGDSNYFPKYGCYRRHGGYSSTTKTRYSVEDTEATGHGTLAWKMTNLTSKIKYGSAGTVIQWSPNSDVNVGSCQTVTVGVKFQGVGIDSTQTVCPSKLHPSVGAHNFDTAWQGGSTSRTEAEEGVNTVAIAKPYGSGFSWGLYYGHCYYGGVGLC